MLSTSSKKNLLEAHPLLQKLINQFVLDYPNFPIQVNDARRGRAEQEKAFAHGNSRAHFGQSAHNYTPAIALDIYPLPVNFNKLQPFRDMGIKVKVTAKKLGIPIAWGGDWKSIKDFPHFELTPWTSYAKKAKLYMGSK